MPSNASYHCGIAAETEHRKRASIRGRRDRADDRDLGERASGTTETEAEELGREILGRKGGFSYFEPRRSIPLPPRSRLKH